MHELSIMENILKIVLSYAEKNDVRQVMAIRLQIGKLSDLEDEWVQRYFDFVSMGTVAQGAKLKIERTPIWFKCQDCATVYDVEITSMGETACPGCGQNNSKLISGREYTIKSMEVQ